MRARRKLAKTLLTVVLGFVPFSLASGLTEQDPAHAVSPAPPTSAPSTSSAEPVADVYLIRPNHVLDIYVYDVPELSRTYKVSPEGIRPRTRRPIRVAIRQARSIQFLRLRATRDLMDQWIRQAARQTRATRQVLGR